MPFAPPTQDDTMRETVQQQLGASVPTNFGIFPSSSFLKVRPLVLGGCGAMAKGGGGSGSSMLHPPCPIPSCRCPGGVVPGCRTGGQAPSWLPPALTVSPFCQAKQEQEEGMAYYGKVTFPCPPGHSQAHRLLLTPELLHKLQSHFVS